jgi:hypothetical protein
MPASAHHHGHNILRACDAFVGGAVSIPSPWNVRALS